MGQDYVCTYQLCVLSFKSVARHYGDFEREWEGEREREDILQCLLLHVYFLFFFYHSASRSVPVEPSPLPHLPPTDPMAPFTHYYLQAGTSVEAHLAIR